MIRAFHICLEMVRAQIMNEDNFFNISIICPSPKGKEIAVKLQKSLRAKLYIKGIDGDLKECSNNLKVNNNKTSVDKEKDAFITEKNTYVYGENFKLNDITKEVMKNSKGIIFISSAGIAVRAIAQFLQGKDKDPGVVVVDLCAKYAINILSGHLGGGNELTLKVSEILNAIPIITTASDNLGITAPDIIAKENNLIIEDLKKAKYIATLLVDNKTIGVKDDYGMIKINKGYEKVQELKENCIWITNKLKEPLSEKNTYQNLDYSKILRLINKDLVLGIGCKRGTTYEKLYNFISNSLLQFNLDIRAVAAIVSIDIKENEEGIIKLSEKINCPFKTFSKEEIKTVQCKYDKSEFVLKTLGVTGVCEPCVDLMGAHVIISKIKHDGMTLAIGAVKNT